MKELPAKTCPSCGERYGADVLYCPRDGNPLGSSSPLLPASERDPYLGMELAGQITIKHLLGVGSMGRVYCAFQAGIDRDVAVKILHRQLSSNAELVTRFHREAKIASRLVHPNVVQVLMTGCLPLTADPRIGGELYLVMEHLDGMSLLSALAAADTGEAGAALPLPRALHLALQLCDAVGEAHAQGIVHRDLKPENVMLVRRGEDPDYVKVLDFGIARLDWGDRSMATQAGRIFGTAKYISPEGAEGLHVGPAADVYAIATILYQCLAGRTPFEGDSPVGLLVQHTQAKPPDLQRIPRASYVPSPIAAVIMQSLAKKPEDRPDSARALGRELIAAARASGLDPETIVSSSSLIFRPSGGVKLASRERTKALELTPELAAKIGGVASRSSVVDDPRDTDPCERHDTTPAAPHDDPSIDVQVVSIAPDAPLPSFRPDELAPFDTNKTMPGEPISWQPEPSAPGHTIIAMTDELPAASSKPEASAILPPPVSVPPVSAPPVSAPPADAWQSTMQGTEVAPDTSARRRASPRARIVRGAAIAALATAAVMIAVVGGQHLATTSTTAEEDAIEGYLADVRDCTRRHAWDSPKDRNVKDLTTAALALFPGDVRLLDAQREAGERIVTDALGRKYAGANAEALHLAKLATELHPGLTTARHLVAELEASMASAEGDAGAAGPTDEPDRPDTKAARDVRAMPPQAASTRAPAPLAMRAPTPPLPSASATPSAKASSATPPPLPSDRAPAPKPSSGGPWL